MKNCEYLGKGISSPLMLGGRYTPRSGLVFILVAREQTWFAHCSFANNLTWRNNKSSTRVRNLPQVFVILPLIGIHIISACLAETRIKVVMFVGLQKRRSVIFASNLQLIKRRNLSPRRLTKREKPKNLSPKS